MTTSLNSTGVLFPDSTQQATAARSGVTTVTLTSAASGATLSSSSGQVIRVVTDSTKPVSPSITMPSMTTVPVTANNYQIVNTTNQSLALKDAGGTTREYVPAASSNQITVIDNTTANGVWSQAYPPNVAQINAAFTSTVASLRVTASYAYGTGSGVLVRLDSTNAAYLWYEGSNTTATSNYYAQLLTFNFATGAVTVGNRVTLASYTGGVSGSYIGSIAADSDNAGHACVLITTTGAGVGSTGYGTVVGLSVSGGTLYVSGSQSTGLAGASLGCCTGTSVAAQAIYCSYLGANNAYGICFGIANNYNAGNVYVQGFTVSGTTTVTLTASGNNTSFGQGTSTSALAYGARTGLTTFVSGANANVGRAIAYSTATNTFSITTRSNQARLDIEQAFLASYSSFATGGFMFGSSSVMFGPSLFDVTNVGAAGVTASVSTAANTKSTLNSAYNTTAGGNFDAGSRSSINVSGNTYFSVSSSGRYYTNDSSSVGNYQYAGAGISGTPILLSGSNLIAVANISSPSSLGFTLGGIATPFTA